MFRSSGIALGVVALMALALGTPGQAGVPMSHSTAFRTWTPPTPSAWPPPLIYVPLAYDPHGEQVLLVGGQHWDVPWLDPYVRALDPDLKFMPGKGAWPPSRPLPGPMRPLWKTIGPMVPEYDLVTYDIAAGRVIATVSFLWNSAWEPASQTWSFDPESGVWEERSPVGSMPPGLCGCGGQAAYNRCAGVTIVFGGIDIVGYFACLDQGCTDEQWMALDSNDTWVYDDGTSQWTRMPRPADEGQIPVPRNTHALAYDPDTDRLVLFGGDNGVVSLLAMVPSPRKRSSFKGYEFI